MSRRAEWVVLVLGVIAVIAWLTSYSWLLGAVVPMDEVDVTVSPWFVAEVVAVVAGASAVVVALAGSGHGTAVRRRARVGAILGGVAAALSLLSLSL